MIPPKNVVGANRPAGQTALPEVFAGPVLRTGLKTTYSERNQSISLLSVFRSNVTLAFGSTRLCAWLSLAKRCG